MSKAAKSQPEMDVIGQAVAGEDDLDVSLRKRYRELAIEIGGPIDIWNVLRETGDEWFGHPTRGYFRVQNLQAGSAHPNHTARAIKLLEQHKPPTYLARQGLVKK